MDWAVWIAIITVVILLAVGIFLFVYLIRKGPEQEMTGAEYKMFFYLGVGYLVVGAFLSFVYPGEFGDYFYLMIMGAIFISVGLSNIEKWGRR